MNGHAYKSRNVSAGTTTPGQNTSGIVWFQICTRHAGKTRSAPSSQPIYQSGCAAVVTALGRYGPYNHSGLICARPPRAAVTATTPANRPTDFAVYVGHKRTPTTLRSVRFGPGNCVCF